MPDPQDVPKVQPTPGSEKVIERQMRSRRTPLLLRIIGGPNARLYSVVMVTIFVLALLLVLYFSHTVVYNSSIIFGVFSGLSFLWFLASATLGREELVRQHTETREEPISIFTISTMAVLEFFTLGLILAYFVTLLVSPSPYLGGNSTAPLAIAPAVKGNSTEWVLNLGGVRNSGGFQGGVQIPLYVIVLGALGAFVNFLSKMPELIDLETAVENKKKNKELSAIEAVVRARLVKQQDAIRLLADYFLAPLIAIGVYFLLVQAGTSSSFSIGIVALGAGLSAPSIVLALKTIVNNTIKSAAEKPP